MGNEMIRADSFGKIILFGLGVVIGLVSAAYGWPAGVCLLVIVAFAVAAGALLAIGE
jgi:4-hydroxybenzoate polyprenyltransferase